MRPAILLAVLFPIASPLALAQGHGTSGGGGRINQLKVLSDKIDDVTTVENIVKSFVKPGMCDQERSQALWTAVVKYRHQTAPPNEYLAGDWEAHDPVKIFNVYGYCMCCCCSALVEALNREDGREAQRPDLEQPQRPRGPLRERLAHVRRLADHVTFPAPTTASPPRSTRFPPSIADWYAKHPGYQKNGDKIIAVDAQGRLDGAGRRRAPPCWRTARSTAWATSRPGRTAGTPRWSSTTARARSTSTATRSATAPLLAAAGRVVRPRGRQPRPAR